VLIVAGTRNVAGPTTCFERRRPIVRAVEFFLPMGVDRSKRGLADDRLDAAGSLVDDPEPANERIVACGQRRSGVADDDEGMQISEVTCFQSIGRYASRR